MLFKHIQYPKKIDIIKGHNAKSAISVTQLGNISQGTSI